MPSLLSPAPTRPYASSIASSFSRSADSSPRGSVAGSIDSRTDMWRSGATSTHSPVSRARLLSNASSPGMSPRLSESSLASYRQPSNPSRSLAGRFGPTASLSAAPSLQSFGLSKTPADAGFSALPAAGSEDDDELDDQLHTFTAAEKRDLSPPFDLTSWRGWANSITLLTLAVALVVLFGVYPIASWYYGDKSGSGSATSGYNLGGINSTGQYPSITGLPQLIDADTPSDVYTRKGYDGETWNLVFSDEFNKAGRTFYDGDDPFFTAMDIHYWPTGDFEWYDPTAVTTKDGHLLITITQEPIHDLNFKSGMLQSWNQLCFNRNAYFEVSVSLPGVSSVGGFWPGVWAMGNLGRPGYGASTDGMWPYSYAACDIGTLPNQTYVNGTGPVATLTTGASDGTLSYLPGQRCSACTCAGESHPGPSVDVGRAAPEIDMLEAQIVVDQGHGQVSQSAQFAPYDDYYEWDNLTAGTFEQMDTSITEFNNYLGGYYQQAVSSLTMVDDAVYYDQTGAGSGQFRQFGFEYSSNEQDREKAYVVWEVQGKKSWSITGAAIAPNPRTEIGQRLITEEPMALIFNLGMSNNFQTVDFSHLTFPNYLRVDYIRVYQRTDGSVGCDPSDRPTAAYIEKYAEVYSNPNLTTWEGAGYTFPKNSLSTTC